MSGAVPGPAGPLNAQKEGSFHEICQKDHPRAPLSDAEGLESWLEDLALQGLYLKTFRPLFCTFIPGPVKKTRYRLGAMPPPPG